MRICKTYDVTFRGKLQTLQVPAMVDYWVVDDDGKRFEVKVPNHPKITESFEWMSDNDCLRHLQHVSPSYTTNVDEVEKIEYYNAMMEENAHARGAASRSFDITTGQWNVYVPNQKPVPDREFEVKWTFWSREHAVMFKLACGGDLEA